MPAGAAFVTGGLGFAGRHLVDLLRAGGQKTLVPSKQELDLRDEGAVRGAIADAVPAAVFHLAAFSSPRLSWERPGDAFLGNLQMTLNVLEAVRHEAPAAHVVLVGSGQVYGEPSELPVCEDAPLEPGNPYAVAKAAGDLLGRQYAEAHGLRVVRMRPFNHAGPGQADEYVVSSLAKQVAEAEAAGRDECLLVTGNPESARDFTDVRDVVRAYALAAEAGAGVFNVCSGRATRVADLVEMVCDHARLPVHHEVDPALLRDHDTPVLYGSHDRLTEICGWNPETPLEKTIGDTIEWWRAQVQ